MEIFKFMKIWIGENHSYGNKEKEHYDKLVQKELFKLGYGWIRHSSCNYNSYEYNPVTKTCLLTTSDGLIYFDAYSHEQFKEFPSNEFKLKVGYVLEEFQSRKIICIGDNEYYEDELETALKNIKPI